MNAVDDFPEVGQDPPRLPICRQDKVIDVLTAKAAFVQKVLQKSPITAYRFGSVADEADVVKLKEGDTWTAAQWATWLKPTRATIKIDAKLPEDEQQQKERAKLSDLVDSLVGGTNVGGAALQIAKAGSGQRYPSHRHFFRRANRTSAATRRLRSFWGASTTPSGPSRSSPSSAWGAPPPTGRPASASTICRLPKRRAPTTSSRCACRSSARACKTRNSTSRWK